MGAELTSAGQPHLAGSGPSALRMLLANSTGSGWVRHEPDEG
jgi:hypothetical protein